MLLRETEGTMYFTISWTRPLNTTERRRLGTWLGRLAARFPGLAERRRGAVLVQGSDPQAAHAFAALTMTVMGRHPFSYALDEGGEQAEIPAAA
jgi:hypothetical protein